MDVRCALLCALAMTVYLRFGTCYEVNIMQLCSLVLIKRICKHYYALAILYEKCKFLSMGYISALTQASVLI